MSGFQGQRAQRPVPSTSPSVRFFPFAEGGVLFQEGTRRIWALNASSAFIWCCLPKTGSIEALVTSLAGSFSIDDVTARRDISAALAGFEREGLFDEVKPFDSSPTEELPLITFSDQVLAGPRQWAVRQSFRTPAQVVDFCCEDLSLGEVFAGAMSHLSVPDSPDPRTRLAVLANPAGKDVRDIYVNGRECFRGIPENEVIPHLFILLFVSCCEALRDSLLFHAGVVGKEGRVVLLPAEAGSGKTTLTAALAARGWRYFSDELAALDVNDLRVHPLPLPMSIKPGSVDVLTGYYPDLSARTMFRRPDGKVVRYLPPPPPSLAGDDSADAIHALIFPEYRQDGATCLNALEKRDALQRLARTGSSNREFTARDVEAMIAVVEHNPCHELIFSNLEEAISLIEDGIIGKQLRLKPQCP